MENQIKPSLLKGHDNLMRCWWCGDDPLYMHYHDTEWGIPTHDNTRLFEKICLEGFQSGLSWITILRKRENFRAAFDGFDIHKVAEYDNVDVQRLLADAGIIRHRGKIEATINNAARAIETIKEFGSLHAYFTQFKPAHHKSPNSRADVNGTIPESLTMSKDLKKRGWKFVGPTTCYAFMQAMGIVNDHLCGCDFHNPPLR